MKTRSGMVFDFYRPDILRVTRNVWTPSDTLEAAILVGPDIPPLIPERQAGRAFAFKVYKMIGGVLFPADRPDFWRPGEYSGPFFSGNFAWSSLSGWPTKSPVQVWDRWKPRSDKHGHPEDN